jgi:RsiW-degrading membrane proteinase PrsW (M82 family)
MWLHILWLGALLWVLSVVVTFVTQNPNLVPTVILLGSFLVPITFVTYAFEHEASRALLVQNIFTAFVVGGVIGVLGASLLESALLPHTSVLTYAWVGLIEEATKLVGLWLVARRLPMYFMRDGIVLGAAVGFGFAAFESSGYAFNALFTSKGLSLSGLIQTELLRGVLAPFGHGLWTGILGGILFRGARNGRLHVTRGLVFWYLVVALLHALWDSSSGLALLVTLIATATVDQWYALQLGAGPTLNGAQQVLYTIANWVVIAIDAAIGVLLLRGRVKQAAGQPIPTA